MKRQRINERLALGDDTPTGGGSGVLVLEIDTTVEFHVTGSMGGRAYEETMKFGEGEGVDVELDWRAAKILRRAIDDWLDSVGR